MERHEPSHPGENDGMHVDITPWKVSWSGIVPGEIIQNIPIPIAWPSMDNENMKTPMCKIFSYKSVFSRSANGPLFLFGGCMQRVVTL